MKSRPLVLLLAAVLACGLIWLVAGGGLDGDRNSPVEQVGLSPGETPAEGGSTSNALPLPPAPEAEALATTEREAIAAPENEVSDEDSDLGDASEIPADAIWVEGRVVLGPVAIPDESIVIEARGKRFKIPGRDKSLRTYRTKAASDGTFRIAFAKGTRKGTVSLDARYHYLEKPERIELSKTANPPLSIEPKLGGVIRTIVSPQWNASAADLDLSEVNIVTSPSNSGVMQNSATCDAEGRSEALGLAPGPYVVRLYSDDFVDRTRLDVSARPGEVVEVELELKRGVRVAGRVLDPRGEPVVGAELEITSTLTRDSEKTSISSDAETDEKGEFVMRGVPAGTLELEIEAEGFVKLDQELGEYREGDVVDGLRPTLSRGLSIAGDVHWPDGSVAAGAEVRVRKSSREHALFAYTEDLIATTDAAGHFEFQGLGKGRLIVRAKAAPRSTKGENERGSRKPSDWIAELRDVEPGTVGLSLVLEAGAQVRGLVVDDTGAALDRFRIAATPDTDSPLGGIGQQIETQTFRKTEGFFALEGLRDGSWKVRATASKHAPSKPISLRIPYDGPDLRIVVERVATITGRVQDPSGAPVAGAVIEAETKGEDMPFSIISMAGSARTTSDDTGEFELKRVEPGMVELRASAHGFGASETLTLEVQPASERRDALLLLRRAARILGQVDPSASPVGGRWITVQHHESGASPKVESDASGHFSAEDLEPGEYTLTLGPAAADDQDGSSAIRRAGKIQERVEIGPGETLHVRLGAPPDNPIALHGRVVSAGAPVAGCSVTAHLRDEDGKKFEAEAVSDEGGTFLMTLAAPGEYRFSLGNSWSDRFSVRKNVPNQESVALVFELPTGSIAGIVLRPDGAPAGDTNISLTGRSIAGEGSSKTSASDWISRFSETEHDGTFAFHHLPPGAYALEVGGNTSWLLPGDGKVFGRQRRDGLELSTGQSIDEVVIELTLAGTVEGFVFAPDGLPAARATISIAGGPELQVHGLATVRTDESGHFRYRGLAPGKVRLLARKGEFESDALEVRVVEEEVSNLDFHLRRP